MGFNNLTAYKATDDARTFTFNDIIVSGKSPTLTVRHAGKVNNAFYQAMQKVSAKDIDKYTKKGKIDTSPAAMQERRNNTIELYVNYIVIDWHDVIEDDGKECPFSQDKCREFLSALPDEYFAELVDFCSKPDNFVDDDAVSKVMAPLTASEKKATAGN